VADLEDRVVAKDQTIRSLESQLDFFKNKLANQTNAEFVAPESVHSNHQSEM